MAQNYWDISCATHISKYIVDRWLIKESIIPHSMRAILLANNYQEFPLEIIDDFIALPGDDLCSSNAFFMGNDLGYTFNPNQHKIVKILTFSPEYTLRPQEKD